MIYGNETKVIFAGIQETFQFGGNILTEIQLLTVMVIVVVFGAVLLILHQFGLGNKILAMRDDLELPPSSLEWTSAWIPILDLPQY